MRQGPKLRRLGSSKRVTELFEESASSKGSHTPKSPESLSVPAPRPVYSIHSHAPGCPFNLPSPQPGEKHLAKEAGVFVSVFLNFWSKNLCLSVFEPLTPMDHTGREEELEGLRFLRREIVGDDLLARQEPTYKF